MDKNAKIYIAGHRGLVGSAIWRTLEAQGYTNLIGLPSSELDLRDQATVNAFFEAEKPEHVFLAAARVGGILGNFTHRADMILSNLQIQNNVIDASYRNKVKKLLFLGSSCIYPKMAPQPMPENSLLTSELEYTNEPYAIAKIAGLKLIESLNLQYGTNYLAVQPTNLYGPHDNYDLENGHAFPTILRKFILARLLEQKDLAGLSKDMGKQFGLLDEVAAELEQYGIFRNGDTVTLRLWGTGAAYREFLHADDMAEASVFVMNNVEFKDLAEGMEEVRNTQINIGTGSDLTIKDFAELVKNTTGFTGPIEFDHVRPDGTPRKLCDVSRIHKLGWKHRIDLEEGVKLIHDEYLQGLKPAAQKEQGGGDA